jgi:hypothetical protein
MNEYHVHVDHSPIDNEQLLLGQSLQRAQQEWDIWDYRGIYRGIVIASSKMAAKRFATKRWLKPRVRKR